MSSYETNERRMRCIVDVELSETNERRMRCILDVELSQTMESLPYLAAMTSRSNYNSTEL